MPQAPACARFLGKGGGEFVVAALPVAMIVALAAVFMTRYLPHAPVRSRARDSDPYGSIGARPQLQQKLLQSGGKQLVFVHYDPINDDDSFDEWIYNAADIDNSPVVCGTDMGPQENRKLLAYYPNRRAWLFVPNASPARIAPYPRN